MGRFQAWTLESRTRYALVQGGINAGIVCSIVLGASFPRINVWRALSYVLLGFVVAVLLQGLIWYPRVKRKHSTSEASSTR